MNLKSALCVAVALLNIGAVRADELSQFQELVKRCQESYESRPATEVVFNEISKRWNKRVYAPTRIKYDVRKTDSLVSPLVGNLEITELMAADSAEDEPTARAIEVSIEQRAVRVTRRINFALQGGSWKGIDATEQFEFQRTSSAAFDRRPAVNINLAAAKPPLKSCLLN